MGARRNRVARQRNSDFSGASTICILGMHRSGTSLVARLMNLLGVCLGEETQLMPADAYNPRGFWEHGALVALNNQILARLGGNWHEPPNFSPGWESSPALEDLRVQARDVICTNFNKAALWGWKDPRTCLTLPFWQSLIPSLKYVICLRNPL